MVFESIVSSILSSVLGDYVCDLQTSQLSVGIWSGQVDLSNLRLKTSALEKFKLPINVDEGYLGQLTMNIPWSDLKNKPIKITIRNVYLLAKPKSDTDYDYQDEVDNALLHKFQKLETAELVSKEKGELSAKDASFMTQLATKIIDNLQISIKNIHIRYEDKVSTPERPFSAGITLSELSAVSTNQDWQEAFISEETGIIHKLIQLKSLAVYWNTQETKSLGGLGPEKAIKAFMSLINAPGMAFDASLLQYILKPVSGIGKLIIRKKHMGVAQNTAELEFEELGFELADEQYKTGIALVHSFEMYMRPPRTITPLIDPKAWFKFAATCVLNDIHERNEKWSWAYIKERRDNRKAYIRVRKLQKSGAALSIDDSAILFQLERKLSYEDIRFYRSIANSQLRKEKLLANAAAASAKTTPGTSPTKSSQTWSEYFWGSSSNSSAQKSESTVFTQEQMMQLFETIEYDPNEVVKKSELPKDVY